MLAWIKSTRGSTATATVVAVILAMLWLAPWSKPLPTPFPFPFLAWSVGSSHESAEPPPGASSSISQSGTMSMAYRPPVGDVVPPAVTTMASRDPAGPSGGSSPAVTSSATEPSFDIVRVEPSGEVVVAGRGEPGSTVVLFDGDKPLAQASVDPNGQFALLPPRLEDGNHYLSLRTQKSGQAAVKSVQGVAVAVTKGGTAKPLVALLSPDAPTRVLSDGASLDKAPATTGVTQPSTDPSTTSPVAIQSVEAGRGGTFMASGIAHPGNQCRVYLNGAYLADVTAGRDGRWSVAIEKGMRPGRYTVRADELAPGTSTVVHRAEVPFDYPVAVANGAGVSGRLQLMNRAAGIADQGTSGQGKSTRGTVTGPSTKSSALTAALDTAPTKAGADAIVIPNLSTATVSRGDSLWRISKKMLGHGIQYTEIYASNVRQIRDPALIYPGQVFVVPTKK